LLVKWFTHVTQGFTKIEISLAGSPLASDEIASTSKKRWFRNDIPGNVSVAKRLC
jgi:hypothetical protein